jgi:hypothetical protein
MLPSRAWELLAGAILSQLPAVKTSTFATGKLPQLFSFLGLALVLASYVFIPDGASFPGMAALPCVLGAALLIRYGERLELLSSSSLVFVGKVSYSLYLWHWPIFTFLGSANSMNRGVAGLISTLCATYVSWRFVETPVRNFKNFNARHAFTLLIVCSFMLAGACLFIQTTKNANGEVVRDWHGTKTWIQLEQKRDPRRSSCTLQDLAQKDSNFLLKIGDPKSPPTFALWGDSHALALMPGLDAAASEREQAGYYINLKQSLTLCSDIGGYSFNPRENREPVLQWLESRPDIVTVFLANRWGSQIRNPEDKLEIVNICHRLNKAGKHVFFVQSVPSASRLGVRLLSWGIRVPQRLVTVDESAYDNGVNRTGENLLLNELARDGCATALPVNKAFFSQGRYHTGTETHSLYVDDNHLNREGATRAMRFVASLVWPITH